MNYVGGRNVEAVLSRDGVVKYNSNQNIREIIMKQRKVLISGIVFVVAAVLTSIILSITLISTTVTAQRQEGAREKRITSIQIQKGDTLWSIASSNITEEYDDVNDYIKEIKQTNQLQSDIIHEGKFIILPYYADVTP